MKKNYLILATSIHRQLFSARLTDFPLLGCSREQKQCDAQMLARDPAGTTYRLSEGGTIGRRSERRKNLGDNPLEEELPPFLPLLI